MVEPRKLVRSAAAVAAVVVLTIVVYPVAGEFFVELARERGWYDQPGQRLARVSVALTVLAEAEWFHWLGGGILGFAAGVWLDAAMRRTTARREQVEDAQAAAKAEPSPREGSAPENVFRDATRVAALLATSEIIVGETLDLPALAALKVGPIHLKRFVDCRFIGPMTIGFAGSIKIDGWTIERPLTLSEFMPIESYVMEFGEEKRILVGLFPFVDCSFISCVSDAGVGFMLHKDTAAKFKEEFGKSKRAE